MDASGSVIGASKVARDITARKKMEQSLRESEERLNLVLRASGMGTFQIDFITGAAHWNHVEFELLGLQPGEAPPGPETFFQFVHPEDVVALRRAWEEATRHGEFESEFRVIRKDGAVRWLAGKGRILFEANGDQKNPQRFLGVNFDITERRQVAEALRESEDLFAKAFLQSPDGVIIARASDRVLLRANEAICRLWGCTPEEVVGQPSQKYSQWLDEKERSRFMQILEQKGECLNYEAMLLMNGGKQVLASFSSRRITLNGEPCFLSVLRDITENRRTQHELEQLNAHLEQRVSDRTAELEASNRELEAFSYSVSHDLRAPLRAVNGFAQILLDEHAEGLTDKGRHHLGTICEGAQKMGRLIDDLLAFSRLNRAPLKKQTVDTTRLVRGVLEDLLPQKDVRQVEVAMGPLPVCEADPDLLRQVWVNLLSNALKYTQKREVSRVEIGSIPGGTGTVYFVRDNGTGFEMRYVHKLFGVFQRLHRSEDYEGTGVGLAIVQRIIHRHGGRVWAEGEPNKGATFYFTLNGGDTP
jgi:PAS domain S-box-containing protein